MIIAKEKEGTLVSTCYVITWADHGLFSCESTIYLYYPDKLGPFEDVHVFDNVFEAKKFIASHVLPGTYIQIAA